MTGEKIALVTGANRGLGFAVAQQLGELGAVVLLGARDELRGRQAASSLAARGLSATPMRIDVTDSDSITRAARETEQRYGRLDILVNNAGVAAGFDDMPSQVTPSQMRDVYETNVFGVVAVTNAMLPLLRRSVAGRIVNMSSHVGSLTLNSGPRSPLRHLNLIAYQSSKTALNAITVAYAKELRDTPIKVNAANPGMTATRLNNYRGHRTPEQAAVIVVRLAMLGPEGPTGTSQDETSTVPW